MLLNNDSLFQMRLAKMSEARRELLEEFAGPNPTQEDNALLTRFIKALRAVVRRRERTVIKGLGAFTWRPFKAHHPVTGKTIETTRLWFHASNIRRKGKTNNADKEM